MPVKNLAKLGVALSISLVLICTIIFGFFEIQTLKREAAEKARFYKCLQKSLKLEARITAQNLGNWRLLNHRREKKDVQDHLKTTGYTALILFSVHANSSSLDQELVFWQEAYQAAPFAHGRVLLIICGRDLMKENNQSMTQTDFHSYPIDFEVLRDTDSQVLDDLGLKEKETPITLLVDANGKIVDSYHPTQLTQERSKRFVKDVFEMLEP